MPRYVLLSRQKEAPSDERARIAREPGVTVLDDSGGRALLIEASQEVAERLRARFPHWALDEEREHPRPQLERPTPRERGGPGGGEE